MEIYYMIERNMVLKGEHHYETVYRVLESAVTNTHLPTLALGALALAIIIITKKINKRLPYVLIAVLITTLISYFIGFEKRVTVSINNIKHEGIVGALNEYNGRISELESKSAERVLLNDSISILTEMYGEKNPVVIRCKYRLDLLKINIENIKDLLEHQKLSLGSNNIVSYKDSNGNICYNNEKTYFIDSYSQNPQKEIIDKWKMIVPNKRIELDKIVLSGGGNVVGAIPSGLPMFSAPKIDFGIAMSLIPTAAIISLLGFMEAISIAKAMAARTKQRLDPNQELIGQGLANIVGSFNSSYAVSGSFSRSAVNYQSGAITGMSIVFSSVIVILTLFFFTPLLYHLPKSDLAAIIIMAVVGLINVPSFIHAWKAQKYDGTISIITLIFTLYFAPHLDKGIFIGVGLSLLLYLFRGMKPSIAMLAKYPDGSFRNRKRFGLAQCKHIAVIRYSGSLYFANVNYLENIILEIISSMPELKHIVLVGNGINELDSSGEDALSNLLERIRGGGIDFSITGLNDNVLDTLKRTFLYYKIGEDHIY